ncbi:hypothetical protein [Streptomyces sp. NPDC048527]|uniref:hypothetical protein n=1 Tax=Streptomyces sp. NPDC048527 TaxID=3365568 RepID=UPI00371A1740
MPPTSTSTPALPRVTTRPVPERDIDALDHIHQALTTSGIAHCASVVSVRRWVPNMPVVASTSVGATGMKCIRRPVALGQDEGDEREADLPVDVALCPEDDIVAITGLVAAEGRPERMNSSKSARVAPDEVAEELVERIRDRLWALPDLAFPDEDVSIALPDKDVRLPLPVEHLSGGFALELAVQADQ